MEKYRRARINNNKSNCPFGPVTHVLKSHHWTTGKQESGKSFSSATLSKDEHTVLGSTVAISRLMLA